jgi:hypothetical protein
MSSVNQPRGPRNRVAQRAIGCSPVTTVYRLNEYASAAFAAAETRNAHSSA